MKKTDLMNTLSRTFGRMSLKAKKHSPEILVVTGVIGVVTSAVMACKATTKVDDILEDTKSKIGQINAVLEDENISEEQYSEEDSKKDLAIVYTQTGIKLIKLYGPSILLGTLSVTSILVGHNILRKRNLALGAAYAAVDKSFKEYRSRVVERFGKNLDKELRYNIKAKEIEEVVTDENGNETIVKKTVQTAELNEHSDYAKFFDEYCSGWSKDPEYNLMFVKQQQSYANKVLKEKGYIFLNDVYNLLGISPTKAGQVVGWVYDEKNPVGDNYVDFGLYDLYNENARDFVNGRERSILLDFNVDGNILDLLP